MADVNMAEENDVNKVPESVKNKLDEVINTLVLVKHIQLRKSNEKDFTPEI